MIIEAEITLVTNELSKQNEKLRAALADDKTGGVEMAIISIEIERLEMVLARLVAETQEMSRIEQAGGEIEPMLWQREQLKAAGELGTKPLKMRVK